ncbi:hypothetical protein [Aeoliella mucimassa]|uniref:Uridine kinase n=1 Tax=Aeoliella mucimassa TaxID=2527972 RepID=A0A518ALD3_9BACT|nr:hypothetical protein [Aeoliella mucimassa]QDU55494.1 uridine kinase [Aeoliella mucimassa]
MKVLKDQESVLQAIRETMQLKPLACIGIDGCMNSGKTTLADYVAKELPATVIHVDEYLNKGESHSHLEAIRMNELAAKLGESQESIQPIIVESICLLKVLEQLSVSPDLLVYVKRLSSGTWHDEMHMEESDSETFAFVTKVPLLEEDTFLENSQKAYHENFEPLQKADLIYERSEDQSCKEAPETSRGGR